MSTQLFSSRSAALRENVIIEPRHIGSLGRRIIETLREWRRRAQSRQELAMLSELERKDLRCRDRIAAEIAKPFWRA
ncbi:MAG: hypothetical protein WAK35_06780 [Xanthobacteraceae bacterium]